MSNDIVGTVKRMTSQTIRYVVNANKEGMNVDEFVAMMARLRARFEPEFSSPDIPARFFTRSVEELLTTDDDMVAVLRKLEREAIFSARKKSLTSPQ